MKNIHLLPTEKPSRLCIHNSCNELNYFEVAGLSTEHIINQHIYITSDEEIKEGDWCIVGNGVSKLNTQFTSKEEINTNWKKIILTTDQDLIKDGVQSIDDELLEWFVKNPSCEFVEINIPQEESKQETLEEFIESQPYYGTCTTEYKEGIEVGAKWMQEQMEKLKDFDTWKEWKNKQQ